MSIAYEINRLNRNKQKVKEQVNVDKDIISEGREFIRGETVRHYPSGIKSMEMSYKDFIPVHTSTESLIETERGGTIIERHLMGNTTQDGTPTPSSPVPVNNVTGEQVVRVCGKNLLNYSAFEKGRINASTGQVEYANNTSNITTTSNIITFTTTQAWNSGITSEFIPIEQGQYIYKIKNASLKANAYIDYYDGSYNFISRYGNKIINANEETTWSINFTNTNAKYIRLHYEIGFADTITLTETQLEKGTSATSFEEYQGKDYEINLSSKNLLQYTDFTTKTTNGITITNNNDGTFSVNGTATADISLAINNETFVPMSGTWRMVGCPSGGSSSTYMLSAYVGYWGGGSPNIDTGNGTSITYTGNVKIRFYIKSGTTCNNLLFKPMVTYDLNATYEDFAPYFEPTELNKIGNYQDFIRKGTGKNLFDLENAYHGSINASGVVGANESYRTTLYIPTKPNTNYYFSTTQISGQTAKQIYIAYYDSTQTFISRPSYNLYESAFTTPSNCYYMRAGVYSAGQENIMLEPGNTKTLYEPYGYKDKWYIEKNIGKVVLNGSENGWSYPSANRFNLDNYVNDYLKKNNDITYVCDSYIGYDQKTANSDFNTLVANVNYGFDFGSGNAFNIRIKDTRYTSIANFKTWLQTHNIIVYYVLSSPTFETISDSTLISQLNENIYLLEGQNNISVSGNLPAGIDVDYIERVNKHLIGNINDSAE